MKLKKKFYQKNYKNIRGLYFIANKTNDMSYKELIEKIRIAVSCKVDIIQLRDKYSSAKEMLEQAEKILRICKGRSLFIINDRADIAYFSSADGVHIGKDDIPVIYARKLLKNKIIGVSVDNAREAKKAEKEGADYISIGPIFKTDTKTDVPQPTGVAEIIKLKKIINIPVVAIGGIKEHNIDEVVTSGADAIAISSAIMNSPDIRKTIMTFEEKLCHK